MKSTLFFSVAYLLFFASQSVFAEIDIKPAIMHADTLCDSSMHGQHENRKLRILFITDIFPHPSRQYIDNQIRGFIDAGHKVYILARKRGVHDDDEFVRNYNLSDKIFYQVPPRSNSDYDILYCQFGNMGEYCIKLMKNKQLTGKMVVYFRGGDATRALRQNPHRFNKVFKRAHCILTVCNYFRGILLLCGSKKEKTFVHHSAIDCDKIKFSPSTMPDDGIVRCVTIARLDPMKGHEYAIHAIVQVYKKYPNIRYDIIGDGRLYDELSKLITDLGAQDYITLVGYMHHDQAMQKLSEYHLVLVPSCTADDWNQEGIPNAAMEAMAKGKPVVGTVHAGLPELVEHGKSGRLVPEKNASAMAEEILYLIENSHLWESMGTAGRAHVLREHNKKIENKKVLALFKSLL